MDVMEMVEQFNAENNALLLQVQAELAAKNAANGSIDATDSAQSLSGRYACNTGDADFDNLMNEAQHELSETRALLEQARMELGPGKYLNLEDAMNLGGSQGVSDFLQQKLEWMEHLSPEQLRQYEHQAEWQHEVEMARQHEHELIHQQGELMERFTKHQTEAQFQMEKDGYHQVNPWGPYHGQQGNPNIFEKDGHFFKLDDFGNRYWQSDAGDWHPMP